MAAQNANSENVLCAEILAEARRNAAEILRKAHDERETALARTNDRAKAIHEQKLEAARTEATRRTESIFATVPLEIERLRSARMEMLFDSIYLETKRALKARDGFDYRQALLNLAIAPISRIAGDELVLKLSPADRENFGPWLIEQIVAAAGRSSLRVSLVNESALSEGGLIIEDANGRQVWDNRLAEKLKRMWPTLRRQIANTALCPAQTAA